MPSRASLKQRLGRYRQIGHVLARHGFGVILQRTHLARWLHLPASSTDFSAQTAPFRVRQMLEELGPTFVKLGQILSTRPDLIPFPYLQELEKLQDQVSPIPGEKIQQVVEEELKGSLSKFFLSFDLKPLASGSIAQVHLARLPDNSPVALKVRKPGIEALIETDLQILLDLAGLIARFIKEAEVYQPVHMVQEFARSIRKELDLSLEGRRMERFRKNFAGEERIIAPCVYQEFTTTKLLTMSWIDGVKITRVKELEEMGINRRQLARSGARATLKQIFVDGFFHADPHPGNLFVTREGKICYLDFGITGHLDQQRMSSLVFLLQGLVRRDADRIVRGLISLHAVEEQVDVSGLKREIEEMLEFYYDLPLKEIKLRPMLESIFTLMRNFRVRIPADLSLLAKALMTTEGVGTLLDPEFNLMSEIEPVVGEIVKKHMSLSALMKGAEKNLTEFYFLAREVPSSLESFLRHLRKGALNLTFEHEGLEELTSSVDKASNRIAFSLIIAALLVASALIVVSGKGHLILGYPSLGVLGFFFAAIMGIWLLIGILRAGKL